MMKSQDWDMGSHLESEPTSGPGHWDQEISPEATRMEQLFGECAEITERNRKILEAKQQSRIEEEQEPRIPDKKNRDFRKAFFGWKNLIFSPIAKNGSSGLEKMDWGVAAIATAISAVTIQGPSLRSFEKEDILFFIQAYEKYRRRKGPHAMVFLLSLKNLRFLRDELGLESVHNWKNCLIQNAQQFSTT
jgi:hypothetical protein